MGKEKESYLYYCNGKKRCKNKKNGCYMYGGECKLTTDKKYALPSGEVPNTFEVEIEEN